MRKRALLVLILLTPACGILGLDGTTTRTLEVAPYKAGCTGLFPTLCLQVREVGQSDFLNLFETPIGFDYEWGFHYVISVKEKELDEVPADASSIRRTLERVISKTPVEQGSTFELLVVAEGLVPANGSRYVLFSGPEEVECSSSLSCEGLADFLESGDRVLLSLRFPAISGEPFEIVEWQPCESLFGSCQ